ncbi:target of Nesh-SH3 isoform 4-T4 [Menidia menidia]
MYGETEKGTERKADLLGFRKVGVTCSFLSPPLRYRGIDGAGAASSIHKSSPVSCNSPESQELREVQPLGKRPLSFLQHTKDPARLSDPPPVPSSPRFNGKPTHLTLMRMQQHPCSHSVALLLAFLAGTVVCGPPTLHRSRVRRQNMKVRISATGDTIVMKFLRPNSDIKLEGYILGYGSSMFSKQFIQLPENNGQPYETEFDAEPKYLIAVQPIPSNEVKKQCTGKVELEKPLHLVIGSVTPTSVLLSWGTLLKTPYEGNIMNECLEDGHYMVRYREKNRKWNYQTCPTSDTVIDNLKPNTVYEFGVQPNTKDGTGVWSKPVIHNISMPSVEERVVRKILKRPHNSGKPLTPGPHSFPYSPQHVPRNWTRGRLPFPRNTVPQTTLAPRTAAKQEFPPTPPPRLPGFIKKQPIGSGVVRSPIAGVPHSPNSSSTAGRNVALPRPRTPSHSTNLGVRPFSPPKAPTSSQSSNTPGANGVHHRGNALPKPVVWSKGKPAVLRNPVPGNKRPNLVGKPNNHDKPMNLKQGDKESILKPFTLVTAKPKQDRRQQTTTAVPAVNSSRFDINENSSIFRPLPASEVDIMGKKRFVAPHVIYKTDKKPDEPCSITSSLAYFPDDEFSDQNVTGPPRTAPSNLTVVTVEGCPSFVILDWEKTDNETTEYEVVSTTTGPNGQEVSILTTNQTHTAVENLTPESSYEFKVTPKNELGSGPSSDPVTFSTESADPRVSEHASGKDAIWTQFPFKSDAYSECNGKQYVKRTWYRKFVGIQLCNSLRYKIYLSDSLTGKFYNIGDQTGHGEDHCQFVDSFLDGRTGTQMLADQLPSRTGFFRAMRQEPVSFGEIGGKSHATYVGWYECGTPIPGKW